MTAVWNTFGEPVSVWDTMGNLVWGGDPVDPPDPVDPDTIEGQIVAARPGSFVHTWDIAADGSRDYTTLTAAASAAQAVITTENGTTRQPRAVSPYRRHLFRVWPGEYKEPNVAFPSHFALIGMGGVPEDVRIWDDRGNAGTGGTNPDGSKSGENIINTSGRSMWVENVWLDHASDDPEWHSVRIVGPAGDIGSDGYTRGTVVFSRVRMTSAFDGMNGKCALDATITHYDVLMDRVWFDTPGQGQSINAHIGREARYPTTLIFHGCSNTAGYGFRDDPTLPNNGRFPDGTIPGAIPVGLHDTHGGHDTLYWVESEDSVWDIGRRPEEPDKPMRGGIALVRYEASQSDSHIGPLPIIDPDAPSLITRGPGDADWIPDPQSVPAYGTLTRVIPAKVPELTITDGTSDGERSFYGANPATNPPPPSITVAGTAGSRTFPAGRIYYVPITLPGVGFHLASVQLDLAGTGQVAVASAFADPDTGVPYSTAAKQVWAAGAVSAGATSVAMIRRWYFPGHDTMWIGVGQQGTTGTGALVTAGGPTVYYADGYAGGTMPDSASLSVLPVGEPYPIVTAVRA